MVLVASKHAPVVDVCVVGVCITWNSVGVVETVPLRKPSPPNPPLEGFEEKPSPPNPPLEGEGFMARP
jgi:hypothetical protein